MKLLKTMLVALLLSFGFSMVQAQTGNKVRHVAVMKKGHRHVIKRITLHHH